jgi:hypothetical protein
MAASPRGAGGAGGGGGAVAAAAAASKEAKLRDRVRALVEANVDKAAPDAEYIFDEESKALGE